MPKLTITINDSEIEVEAGTSILEAAKQLGIEIPHFCYHDRLSPAGNCRMCLVELEGAPKPVASCCMNAGDKMVVRTNSEKVKKSRNGVMELMLVNHPLDCPICDQGGECDLQDQAVAYGYDRSRYHESKRAVPNKDVGPLIKTIMTRCINCTRCVRFGEEIAGTPVLGQMNRGEDAEIGTFIETAVSTELSGNLIDICPVGALTSRPFAFTARPWELEHTKSVDVHDGLGVNIRVDSRAGEVMRVQPRLNENINQEWLDDRARFSCDGLKHKRLDRPYVRNTETGKLEPASWEEAFTAAAEKLKTFKGDNIAAFAGDLADVESMIALKDLMHDMKCSNLECRVDGARFDTSSRAGYVFNSSIAGVDRADAVLIVGSNPRWEAALLNTRLRAAAVKRHVPVALIGKKVDLSYPYEYLGEGPRDLEKLLQSKSGFAKVLQDANTPMIIVGAGAFAREDGEAVQALARCAAETFGMLKEEWNGFNVLHHAASRVGAIEIGFLPEKPFKTEEAGLVYLLNVDTPEVLGDIHPHSCVIYQGHHGDKGAARADIIFPGAAYTEKSGIYMNTEGRPQMALKAVDPPGEAREDWKILRALSGYCKRTLRYDDLAQLHKRLVAEFPQFDLMDEVAVAFWEGFGKAGEVSAAPFKSPVEDFYLTNVITTSSPTMQECSKAFLHKEDPLAEAAE